MSDLPPRKHISKKTRALVFEKDAGVCYLCGQKVEAGVKWELEHEIALQLGGKDEMENYRVAHVDCHREKSKGDIKLIAKGRRIRRNLDPETRKKSKKPIVSRGFDKTRKKKIQSRPFGA